LGTAARWLVLMAALALTPMALAGQSAGSESSSSESSGKVSAQSEQQDSGKQAPPMDEAPAAPVMAPQNGVPAAESAAPKPGAIAAPSQGPVSAPSGAPAGTEPVVAPKNAPAAEPTDIPLAPPPGTDRETSASQNAAPSEPQAQPTTTAAPNLPAATTEPRASAPAANADKTAPATSAPQTNGADSPNQPANQAAPAANQAAPAATSTPAATGTETKSAAKADEAAGTAAPPARMLPPAMATKSKIPSESDYDEVHVKPMVKSADEAKFDPNSTAAAEAEIDPKLRTHTKPIRVDVDLVLVPVTVTDPMNRLVTGLEKENFTLLDNGEKQAIQHFSSDDAPISLGVIFDMSGSMSNKIERAREAVIEFFKTANPEDEFFLIAFNDKPMLVSDFTSSVDQLQERLAFTVPKGRTALLDAIYLGMAKMREAKLQRKALLIISDGGDNRSRYTENELKSMVKEADVQIFAIGLFDQNPRSDEERYGPQLLSEVTDVTGGRTITVTNPNEMRDVATKIGVELRNEYVLGYRPSKPARNGKWRKVKVKLNAPKGLPQLSVYAKTGYYAPNE
jgi:Ca-activated chloride channel family protein